jgi:hypothetical protein
VPPLFFGDSEGAGLFEGLSAGLTLGLATGTACLASCGPVYAAYLLGEKRTGLQSLIVILLLNAGRFIAYALFGALVGYLGGSIPASVRVPVACALPLLLGLPSPVGNQGPEDLLGLRNRACSEDDA